MQGEDEVCSANIYITGEPSGSMWETVYTAAIVGDGVKMEQAENGGAIIRLK